MNKSVKYVSAALILLLLAMLSGCAAPRGEELSKRLIVEAIGIDYADEEYIVTLQALDTHSAGGGTDPNEKGDATAFRRYTGKTVAEALTGVTPATGLTPLYSQARILVFGKELAARDLSEPLDFFLREYHTRSDILIAVADSTAEDLLRADLGDSAPDAVILEEAVTQSSENGDGCAVKLYRFMDLLFSDTDTAYCPVISLQPGAAEKLQEPLLGKTAFFRENRLAFTADREITRGMLFLTDEVNSASVTVQGEEGIFTLRLIESKTKIRPRLNGAGDVCFSISAEAVCDITEFATPDFKSVKEAQSADAAEAGTRAMRSLIETAFTYLYNENSADVCRLARRAALRYPKKEAAFREALFTRKTADISIQVSLSVRHTGKESL